MLLLARAISLTRLQTRVKAIFLFRLIDKGSEMKNFERGNLTGPPGLNYIDNKMPLFFGRPANHILQHRPPLSKIERLHDSFLAIPGFITQFYHNTFEILVVSSISDAFSSCSKPLICKGKRFALSREYSIFSATSRGRGVEAVSMDG